MLLYGHEGINFVEKIKKKDNDEKEQQLIDQMMATVGAAVSQMEPRIKAGTLRCPSAEGNIKTPKQKKSVRRCSSMSTISSTQQTIFFDSTEKEIAIEASGSSSSMSGRETSFGSAGDYCWMIHKTLLSCVPCAACCVMSTAQRFRRQQTLRYASNMRENKL